MIHAFPPEKLREITGVPGPGRCFYPRSIFVFVRVNERARPALFISSFFFPQPHERARRRVMDRRLEPPRMRMSNARQRRMNRADDEFVSAPLQFQHLNVAKSLRKHRVTRIEVAEPHLRISETGNRIPESRTSSLVRRSSGNLFEIRYLQSEIRKTARLCPDPSRNPAKANPPCLA
jgi:hypothetical protein